MSAHDVMDLLGPAGVRAYQQHDFFGDPEVTVRHFEELEAVCEQLLSEGPAEEIAEKAAEVRAFLNQALVASAKRNLMIFNLQFQSQPDLYLEMIHGAALNQKDGYTFFQRDVKGGVFGSIESKHALLVQEFDILINTLIHHAQMQLHALDERGVVPVQEVADALSFYAAHCAPSALSASKVRAIPDAASAA